MCLSAADELWVNREFVLVAVRQNGSALRALRQNTTASEHAADELRINRELVLEAVRQNGPVLRALRLNVTASEYAADELRVNRECCGAAAWRPRLRAGNRESECSGPGVRVGAAAGRRRVCAGGRGSQQ